MTTTTIRNIKWLVSAPDEKNLAVDLTDQELSKLAQDVIRDYQIDRQNRKEWDDQSTRALDLAKQVLKRKTSPWPGASNVKHPLITISTIQFAARAYPEICYSHDTEVLTGIGWKPIWDVVPGTFVYSRRPDGVADFCSVTGTTSHFAERLVHFNGKSIDLMVTEAHEMVLETADGQQLFRPASAFLNKDGSINNSGLANTFIPLTSINKNKSTELTYGIPTASYMRFLGWFLSEGCSTKCRNGTAWGTFKISQRSGKEDFDILKADIEACGFTYTENDTHFIVHAKSMPTAIKNELRSLGRGPDKFIPRHVMFNSSEHMNELLDTLIRGDGHTTEKGHRLYVTTSRQLADDVQELCQYIGVRATIQKINPTGGIIWDCDAGRKVQGILPIYRVTIGKRTRIKVYKLHRELVDYNNRVFCVETEPWHTLYVRRGGRPVWCGNCKGNKIVKCQITGDDPKPPALPAPAPPQPGLGPQPPAAGPGQGPPPGLPPQVQGAPGMPGQTGSGPGQAPGQPALPNMTGQLQEIPKSPKQERADRVACHMNYQLTQEIDDWEENMDSLLHVLPVVGQCYKKVYFSGQDGHNVSELVLPDDCVVSKGKSRSIKKSRRITHRLWIYGNEALEKMRSGIWLDVDLGVAPTTDNDTDAPHEFLEQHRWDDLDGDGYKEPYIVTVHKVTSKAVRVVARWVPDNIELDEHGKVVRIKPDNYFVHYTFIPNPDGSMNALGFGQLLEPINASINTTLNQLLDSGHLYNTGGGFIGRGIRMDGGTWSFKPGEWKKVNATGTSLKENLVPMPVREPSAVLFQLLGFLVNAGQEISSVQNVLTGDAKLAGNMPVGTMMALVEQGLKVFTAIYKRIYRALGEEFKQLYVLNARFLDPVFPFFLAGQPEQSIKRADYLAGDNLVMPVADPELSSDMQRLLKTQALKEVAGRPGLNEVEVTRRMVRAIRPENAEMLLLTDGQIAGREPTPWKPPPPPQMVLAHAKAERMHQQAQEATIRLKMDMLKFKLELQELEEKINNTKADTMLKLAKTEDTGRSDLMETYKLQADMLGKELEMKVGLIKDAVDKFAGGGQAGMEGPGGPGQPPNQAPGGPEMIPGMQ